MSSQTLPESGPTMRPGAPEYAPSELRPEEPWIARRIGLLGAMLAVFGGMVVLFNELRGPRLVGVTWGWVAIFLGAACLLFHAARDPDTQVRRAYGFLGVALLLVTVFLALVPAKPSPEAQAPEMGAMFLPYGPACLFLGLLFGLAFVRHETEPSWRRSGLLAVLGVGGLLVLFCYVWGAIRPDFLVGPGLLLGLLGLAYLTGYVAQEGPASDRGYRVGLAIGVIGVLAFLYALGRSAVPRLFGMQVPPFLVPSGLLMMGLGLLYVVVSLGIVSDNRLVVQTRRELSSYFYSPVAYIVLLGMAVVGWVNYFLFIADFVVRGPTEPIVRFYIFNLSPVIAVLFVVPALTMRLLSEERRTGTYEVLMSTPVNETTVVLGKFLAGLIFFLILWLPWGFYLVALRVENGKPFDYRPLLSFYIALTFSGAAFIAMGLFFSSLTRNQIIAAVLTFMGMLLYLALYLLSSQELSEYVGSVWRGVFQHANFLQLWRESLGGRLPLRSLVLQGSLAVFWLFLTVKVLEARRWS